MEQESVGMAAVIPHLPFYLWCSWCPQSTEFWSSWEFRRLNMDITGDMYLNNPKNLSTKVDEEKTIFIID